MNDQPKNPNPPLVVRTEHLDPAAEAWIAERCEFLVASPGDAAFESVAARITGLVVRTYTEVNEALLDRLPSLKVVARAGVGVDNIDVAACRRRGIEVVHTPDANTQAVVEYVTALLCDALRPRVFLSEAVDQTAWNKIRSEICGGSQMNELSLGILGFGRIGRRIAEVAGAIGFTVRYHDLLDIDASHRAGAEPVSLERLFEMSDALTIHVDGRKTNHGLINTALLSLMKSDSILLNTSRGFVVDESAIAEWLAEHPAAQAVLDVHEQEPFTDDNPLIELPNAHLAPHLASRTTTAMANMSWVVKDLWRVLDGERPKHPAPDPS
ncbi:MAG: NAD(P)-dependent oxidoreductase [Planctomycetota bacterium]|jgi:phosphoglycerate dehydrogenase-like enzyme|nr:NAD(P)-dependent oxidoreductase [Planctomycetota bacterium]MDA1026928.1 NAD(P)-dependent oxidoreductase [Planctomycetota bacterium]